MEIMPTLHLSVTRNVERDKIAVVFCPACGKKLPVGKMYCSIKCKEKTLGVLNLSKEIIWKLNAKIAIFVNDDPSVAIIVFHSERENYAACFEAECTENGNTLDTLKTLIYRLNDEWHQLMGRLRSNYRVQSRMFDVYGKVVNSHDLLRVVSDKIPRKVTAAIKAIGMSAQDLNSSQGLKLLKQHFRVKVKEAHPDTGGSNIRFMRIKDSFQLLNEYLSTIKTTAVTTKYDNWWFNSTSKSWKVRQRQAKAI